MMACHGFIVVALPHEALVHLTLKVGPLGIRITSQFTYPDPYLITTYRNACIKQEEIVKLVSDLALADQIFP